jgi:spermidine synthase
VPDRGATGGRRARRGPAGPQEGRYPVSTGEAELVPDRSDPRVWTLWVNGVPSSPVHLDEPAVLDFEYLRWMADVLELATAPPPAPLHVVHLGGAACALPRHVEAVRPGSSQVAVEVDAELARLVREWFDLPRSPRLRLQAADARAGLERRPAASADAVVRDVFAGDSTPAHLTTTGFVSEAARVLRPGGIYLANVADRDDLAVLRAEVATVRSVFAHTALVADPGALRRRRYANAVLVGSSEPLPVAALTRRLASGAARARLVHGEALADFCAGARPLADPPDPSGH